LDERKKSWENNKKSLNYYNQATELPELKKIYPNLKLVYSTVLQNVAVRIDLAFQAFFRRIKSGEKPGYPRFKSKSQYDSFTFPQFEYGNFLENDYIKISKIGKIYFKKHREIQGKIKTVTIKKTPTNKWFVYFVTDYVKKTEIKKTNKNIGIDVGIENFATFSNGNNIENPRFFQEEQKELAKIQRKIENDKKQNKKIKWKDKKRRARIYERINNKRKEFAHKESIKIIKNYDIICIEDIKINKLIQKRWCSKQICDTSWGMFFDILTHKAESADKKIIKVNPAYTSQTCNKCGTRTVHELKDRIFNCSKCNNSENRDLNAAKNILRLGIQSLEKS
jgi:putative transposase